MRKSSLDGQQGGFFDTIGVLKATEFLELGISTKMVVRNLFGNSMSFQIRFRMSQLALSLPLFIRFVLDSIAREQVFTNSCPTSAEPPPIPISE
jgi:hypothetical protein